MVKPTEVSSKARRRRSTTAEKIELERSLRRAEARGDRYERLCALQKKVSELFGIPLETEDETKP